MTRACLLRTPASTAALQRSLRTMFTNEDGEKPWKGQKVTVPRLTRSVGRVPRAVGAPHGRSLEPLLPGAE